MSDYLIKLSIYITNIFSPHVLIIFCLFMLTISFLYLNIKKIKYREILSVNCPNNVKGIIIISISVFLSGLLSLLVKEIFKISRPENMLVLEYGHSFPSGHTSVMFSFCFSVIFLLYKYFKDHRWYINYLHSILFLSIAFLVGFTRTVLQVHRYEDIFAGIVLGFIASSLSVKLYYTISKYYYFHKNY